MPVAIFSKVGTALGVHQIHKLNKIQVWVSVDASVHHSHLYRRSITPASKFNSGVHSVNSPSMM
jgi:hypothetical protein